MAESLSPLLNPLRRARQRWFEAAVRDTAAATLEALTPDLADLRRILVDYGDAADQVADTLGRVLARMTGEVESLAEEVTRLHERLDKLEAER
jgi:hypothetical protein